MFRKVLTCGLVAAAALLSSSAFAQEAYTNEELAAFALEQGKPAVVAKFRGKDITVSGTFDSFSDTGYGNTVSIYLEGQKFNSWKAVCSFPRDDTAAYDKFAAYVKGDPVTFTGRFQEANDSFMIINLAPCQPAM